MERIWVLYDGETLVSVHLDKGQAELHARDLVNRGERSEGHFWLRTGTLDTVYVVPPPTHFTTANHTKSNEGE